MGANVVVRWCCVALLLLLATARCSAAGASTYFTVGGVRYYGAGQPYTVRTYGRQNVLEALCVAAWWRG
jgi:hypothetical protein